jgi:hypothetical protein
MDAHGPRFFFIRYSKHDEDCSNVCQEDTYLGQLRVSRPRKDSEPAFCPGFLYCYILQHLRPKVIEVPIVLTHCRDHGQSSICNDCFNLYMECQKGYLRISSSCEKQTCVLGQISSHFRIVCHYICKQELRPMSANTNCARLNHYTLKLSRHGQHRLHTCEQSADQSALLRVL